MITITEAKPIEEVLGYLKNSQKVYLIGCGTCATMLHTGGKTEVMEMKDKLQAAGKEVTGWMIIPAVCDDLTREALAVSAREIEAADSILVMSCAFGVQTVTMYTGKAVYPALNSLFIGKEETPGSFVEICMQCGNCQMGNTAGICPLVRCAKSLLNGPCGGSAGGKCEVSPDIPCAWQMIIDRLKALGQLDKLEDIVPPQDWSTSSTGGPRKIIVDS